MEAAAASVAPAAFGWAVAAGGGELRAEDEGEVDAHCAAFYSAENFSIVAKSVSLAAPSWIRPQARLYAQNFLSKRLMRAVDHFFVHSGSDFESV